MTPGWIFHMYALERAGMLYGTETIYLCERD
jgi:hypothetical protein